MKLRVPLMLSGSLIILGCAGETEQPATETEATQRVTMSADEAALEGKLTEFETHYNLHHASMVADFYADSAFRLRANGAVDMGHDAILASLEAEMAGSPTLTLTPGDRMIFGDIAVTRGEFSVERTGDGAEPVSIVGNHLTAWQREGTDWKIWSSLTNYSAPPPESLERVAAGDEPPPDNGTMTDLVTGWQQHYNLGHPSMVADLYTEDAVVSFANAPFVEGREAVSEALAAGMEGSPQIEIHDVGTMDLGDGWALDAGWYAMTAEGGPTVGGSYMILCRQDGDGSWKIHWQVVNGGPV